MQSDTVTLAQELIRRPSVSPRDSGCQEILARRLQALGFDITYLNSGDVTNMWARKGERTPLFAFAGHTDVVPAGDESSWAHPPFSGVIEAGILHGRGAADMKSSIAAMVTACERFCSSTPDIDGSIAFLITSDEEDIAIEGTRFALEKLDAEANEIDWCLVGEPTSEDELGDTIKVGRRGSLDGHITVYGKQGHVAYPHLADNPIHKSGALITALSELDWSDANDDFPQTTVQISNVNAGVGAGNVIPETLALRINFRFSPVTSVERIKRDVEEICVGLELEYRLDWSESSNPYHTRQDTFANLIAASIAKVLNRKPARSTAGGTSDGRFIAKTGAEVIEFGPLNATIHEVNEQISVADVDALSRIYEQILVDLFNDEH